MRAPLEIASLAGAVDVTAVIHPDDDHGAGAIVDAVLGYG
jgi:hypothetical protein